MSYLRTFGLPVIFALMLGACNTVDGVGEDVSATGEVISDTATDVQNDLN